jgi:hypothetical protein
MSDLFDSIQTFYQGNTEVFIAFLVAIVIVLIIKPKAAGKLLGVIAAIIVVGYVINSAIDLTGSATDKKIDAAHRTDKGFQRSEK